MNKRSRLKLNTLHPLEQELDKWSSPAARSQAILAALARSLREAVDATPGTTLTDVRTAVAHLRRLARTTKRRGASP